MSVSSEKNPELVEVSHYLACQVCEPGAPETGHPAESESDLLRSSCAPKPAHERAAAGVRLANNRHQNDEPTRAAMSEMRRRVIADQELALIETSLRLLQRRQGAGMRLPRGPNIPLPGHSGVGAARDASDGKGEQVREWFGRPQSLEPTIMPPPPTKPGRKLHVSFFLALTCFAGAAAYYAFMPTRSLQSTGIPESSTQITSAAPVMPSSRRRARYSPVPAQSEAFSRAEADRQQSMSRSSGELARVETSEPSVPSPAEMISARHSMAKAPLDDEENPASGSTSAVPALKPEEIDVLIKQGERFKAEGDIVTARLLFERAAKAENATAAFALAATYDPIVLSNLGVLGIDTDVEKARLWYQKAQSLGSIQAAEQLSNLPDR
jgi:hypothetical protein